MKIYKCNVCGNVWESAVPCSECPKFGCGSRLVSEIAPGAAAPNTYTAPIPPSPGMPGSPAHSEEVTPITALMKYADFKGRATRKEYWLYVLVFGFAATMVLGMLGGMMGNPVLLGLYNLGMIIPGLAVGARRLHDTNRSAWYLLFALVPLVGSIILLVFFCEPSGPDNQYGPKQNA